MTGVVFKGAVELHPVEFASESRGHQFRQPFVDSQNDNLLVAADVFLVPLG